MRLARDAGNTNVVFSLHDGETLVGQWRSATDPNRTADEYMVWLTQLMAHDGIKPGAITGAIMANVVPQTLFHLRSLCRRYFGCTPLVIGDTGVELGIEVRIDRPEDVGADRLVNAVSAHNTYGGPLIVVDFGTATTFDVIAEDGAYEGGVIAPGVNLSLEALHQAAAQLPRIAIKKPRVVVGKSTVPAMQSGIYWGYIGLVESLIARITKETGETMKVVATGGLATVFAPGTKVIEHVDTNLTIRGLFDIYYANTADSVKTGG